MHKERVRLLGIDIPESKNKRQRRKTFWFTYPKQYMKDHYPLVVWPY